MRVEYRITGTADPAVISYTGQDRRTVTVVRSLPWSHTFEAAAGHVLSVLASTEGETGALRVVIYLDGREHVIREANGAYALVQVTAVVPLAGPYPGDRTTYAGGVVKAGGQKP